MTKFTARLLLIISALTPMVTEADEIVSAIGYDDVLDQTGTQAAAIVLEYHTDPIFSGSRTSLAWVGATQIDTDGDFYVGWGVNGNWFFNGDTWFLEGSFMPGYYNRGSDGSDLGGNILFRTLVGIGYRIDDQRKVSLALDHKSNADTETRNPGSETLLLRYTVDF